MITFLNLRPVKLKLREKNPRLVQNLAYRGGNSCRKELTMLSKVESVESIVSSLATQDKFYNTLTLFFPVVVYRLENVERSWQDE